MSREIEVDQIPPSLWDNGSYNWFNLQIRLAKTTEAELKTAGENSRGFPVLVHEYTHYLQNFTTLFGLTTFMTYVDCFSYFFSKNVELLSDPQLPLRNGTIDKSFGNKTLHNFFDSVYLGIKWDSSDNIIFEKSNVTVSDFSISKRVVLNAYHQKKVDMYHMAFNNQWIPLNELVLRENMAMIATVIAANLPLSEVEKLLKGNRYGLEYTIIYKFLANLFPGKNCLELTYKICETSLLVAPYCGTIHQILAYIELNKISFLSLSETQILNKVHHHINFSLQLRAQIRKGIEMIDQRITTSEKHLGNYEFFIYTIAFWKILKQGLLERQKKVSFYQTKFDMSFLAYYSSIVKSPVIIFGNGKKSLIGDNNSEYVNSIANLSGVLTALHRLYYFKETQVCPFIEANSYCSHKKGEECKSNFLSIHRRRKYSGCLMDNALNIIGVKSLGRKRTVKQKLLDLILYFV